MNLVDTLVTALLDQIKLLEYGIELHRTKSLESMKPLHGHIETTFYNMKNELNELVSKRNK